jgi:hypothetical protein
LNEAGRLRHALIGRERELEAIDALIAGEGSGAAALLLESEAGIGKAAVWLEGVVRARSAGMLLVVGELIGTAAVRLLEHANDRVRTLVGVEEYLAVDVAGRAPDRLDERGAPAQEALLRRGRRQGKLVPLHRELARGTLASILRQASLTADELSSLL